MRPGHEPRLRPPLRCSQLSLLVTHATKRAPKASPLACIYDQQDCKQDRDAPSREEPPPRTRDAARHFRRPAIRRLCCIASSPAVSRSPAAALQSFWRA
ncbi:hypothetical protein HPB50_013116 [Hyalomma asiaticum]|uniref:Uncharacterized protein n=1 Tax=Hyalomma asiaticum TaxID=266040 RepID=A0ACB7S8Z5_HYAAI|nr:hypothetical protein HPB50_013116 [Hyalomma asiaticum]